MIRTYHTGLKDFPEYMLFNVRDDPHETKNLASTHRDTLNGGCRSWTPGSQGRCPKPSEVILSGG